MSKSGVRSRSEGKSTKPTAHRIAGESKMTKTEERGVAPNVHNGTYSVSHPERGHYTLKLHTVQKGELAGKRILSLLVGPDNIADFRGVAFWDDALREAMCWRRFQGEEWVRLDGRHWAKGSGKGFAIDAPGMSVYQKKIAIWADLVNRPEAGFWSGEGYALQFEGRCVVCNRKLTDPVSIERGIGPVCEGRS